MDVELVLNNIVDKVIVNFLTTNYFCNIEPLADLEETPSHNNSNYKPESSNIDNSSNANTDYSSNTNTNDSSDSNTNISSDSNGNNNTKTFWCAHKHNQQDWLVCTRG